MNETDALRALTDADRWIDRVTSQRSHLAEIAELATVEDELRELLRESKGIEAALEPARRDYDAAASESARLRARAGDLDAALTGSTNAKEATALQGELGHVRERLNASEDVELERLVALEPLQASLEDVRRRAQPLVARRETLRATIAALQATLDEEIDSLRRGRLERAADVPLALLTRYESARTRAGVAGAAHVVDGRCDGCRLALAPLDLDRWKSLAAGVFMDCPECGRVLLP